MKISFLAEHPEFIATLAPEIVKHWRHILTEETIESRAATLGHHMNRERLPIGWVAHTESGVLGIASLREHDLPGREDLTPWLGGVFVLPQVRGQKIGATLCAAVEAHAKSLQVDTLYLFTLNLQQWYKSMGWELFEPCKWRGHRGDVMCKQLLPDSSYSPDAAR